MGMDKSNTSASGSTVQLSLPFERWDSQLPPKFDNIEPITPGMNAQVFKAFDTILGRQVFLKRYPIVEGQLAQAFREPQTAKNFTHECLAGIYSAHDLEGKFVLLEMEFLDDGSLKDILDKAHETGTWPSTARVIGFINDAACGLAHLHARGYVHRDIKPANLMLGRRNQKLRLVISDFGLAARIGDNGRAQASKHARLYRPPEAFLGNGYSAASDIYQLGLVMAQLFGCPFNYSLGSRSDQDIFEAASQGRLVDLDQIHAHVCMPLRKVVADCLLPEQSRIHSSGDLIARLQGAATNQGNWRLSTTEDGFTLSKREPLARTRITVNTSGAKHFIRRERQLANGKWRRVGAPLSLKHARLNTCRKFLSLVHC